MKDYISGRDLKEYVARHEEPNVQLLAKWLVAIGYSPSQIQVHPQYPLKGFTPRQLHRVDIAVFLDERRTDETLILIAEVKATGVHSSGLDQLHQLLNRTNAVAGIWFNGEHLNFMFHLKNAANSMATLIQLPHIADNFGHYVHQRRMRLYDQDRQFSVRQVAARIGIEPSYLSKIERGYAPPPGDKIVLSLASVLGDDPDILMAKAGRMPPGLESTLLLRPEVLIPIVKGIQEAPEAALLEIARKVRDGKW